MTRIKLTNVCHADSPTVDRLKRILGRTYMQFRILVCPVGGSFDVLAETDYDAPEGEVKDFLLFALASES